MSAISLPVAGPALPYLRARLARLAEALALWRRGDPAFFGGGVVLLVALLPLGAAAAVDDRLLNGADVWSKPLKFAVALSAYMLTLALYAHALPAGLTVRRWFRAYRAAVLAAIGIEIAWIVAAAAVGTASHFNTEGVWAVVYPVMGLLATLLTSATAVLAVAVARNPATGLSPAVKDGLVLGLALTLPLTLITAGTLSANDGHLVGTAVSDAGGLPFFGWSRQVGDLRVAHFLATHAMHLVPAFALASAWAFGGTRRLPVRLFAAGHVALVASAFMGALAGRPFLPMIG